MKKFFLSLLLAVICQITMAQILQDNEAAVVYYMPKTTFEITFDYDVTEQTPGVFYQYAERYLGTKDIVLEATTSHVLTNVVVSVSTTADTQRAYKITAQKGVQNHLLALSADGVLLGYNTDIAPASPIASELKPDEYPQDERHNGLMPLLEEQFMAGSVAKMAEGAAKQIYRIRETRLNLLAGDMEHVPADGMAMQMVLDELNKQEQALVELFIGKRTTRRCRHTINYTPTQSVSREVLCRLSLHTGIVDNKDLSGEPIYITLAADKQSVQTSSTELTKAPLLSQLYYNLPGSANITIQYKGKTWVQGTWQVAQFGVAVPMAQDWFTSRSTPSIVLNPETGNILLIKN